MNCSEHLDLKCFTRFDNKTYQDLPKNPALGRIDYVHGHRVTEDSDWESVLIPYIHDGHSWKNLRLIRGGHIKYDERVQGILDSLPEESFESG